MKAYRFSEWQQAPKLVDVPEPTAGPGQVVVKVGGAGVCAGDVQVFRHWSPDVLPWTWKLPFTLGHEVAGWVAEVGEGVEGLRVGEAVIVYGPHGCGRCAACLRGMENLCATMPAQFRAIGLGLDGGMAEYVLVPSSRHVLPIGDLDPAEAAPLADAALTPYHAVKESLPLLGPGTTAVVIGIGGLGHLAVQLLRALTPATVVAVSRRDESLALAREAGAHHTVRATADGAADVRGLTAGRGAELVVDCVGSNETLQLAAASAATAGRVKVLGTSPGMLPFHTFALPLECSISVGFWGGLPELAEVVALAATGAIRTNVERFALDEVGEAYGRLADHGLCGRAVVVPAG